MTAVKLSILHAELPDTVVFSLVDNIRATSGIYILQRDKSGNQYPYTIKDKVSGPIETLNVNEWLAQISRGRYSIESIIELAEVFIEGRQSAYTIEDMVECGRYVFELMRKRLFDDGMAGRYADVYDVECLSNRDIRDALSVAMSSSDTRKLPHRIFRFMHVCEKNGLTEFAAAWERLFQRTGCEKHELSRQDTPRLDDELSGLIYASIKKHFAKHKQFDVIIHGRHIR